MSSPPAQLMLVLALLLSADARLATSLTGRHGDEPQVTPKLDPKSSGKFFGKDYPDDLSPKVGPDFDYGHPYPHVQDDAHFDKDYVKDENSDGGEWKEQMAYDRLRQKALENSEKVKRAQERVERAKKALEAAEKTEQDHNEVGSTNGAPVDAPSGKTGAAASGAMRDAIKIVEESTDNLKNCIEELEQAKARLEEMLNHTRVEGPDWLNKLIKDAEEKKKKAAEAKRAYEEALKEYDDEQEELETTKESLSEATDRLRQKRGVVGSEEPKARSGAKKGDTISLATLVAIVVAAVSSRM